MTITSSRLGVRSSPDCSTIASNVGAGSARSSPSVEPTVAELAKVFEEQRFLSTIPQPLAKLVVDPLAYPRPVPEVQVRKDRVDANDRRDRGQERQDRQESRSHCEISAVSG